MRLYSRWRNWAPPPWKKISNPGQLTKRTPPVLHSMTHLLELPCVSCQICSDFLYVLSLAHFWFSLELKTPTASSLPELTVAYNLVQLILEMRQTVVWPVGLFLNHGNSCVLLQSQLQPSENWNRKYLHWWLVAAITVPQNRWLKTRKTYFLGSWRLAIQYHGVGKASRDTREGSFLPSSSLLVVGSNPWPSLTCVSSLQCLHLHILIFPLCECVCMSLCVLSSYRDTSN